MSSFNLDLNQYWSYWNQQHTYHHTASSSLHCALHEGLRVLMEDELEATFTRYRQNAETLWAGLESIGVPYEILLRNGINHPEDRGHRFFAEELIRLFAE